MNGEKEIGILDPEGNNNNPLTGLPYQNLYADEDISIPVFDKNGEVMIDENGVDIKEKVPGTYANYSVNVHSLPLLKNIEIAVDIIKKIRENQVVIIESATGTGKTVILPKLALHALDYKQRVVMTVPRIDLAGGHAAYASKCMDVVVGDEIGYQHSGSVILKEEISGENGDEVVIVEKKSWSEEKTKLLFATDGTIVAMMKNDPHLTKFSMIIIDEAHERNTNMDTLFLLVREALLLNPELKLIITSATLDVDYFANYYKEKGISTATKTIAGKPNKPVEEYFLKVNLNANNMANVITETLDKYIIKKNIKDDVLVFVPSSGVGNKIGEALEKINKKIFWRAVDASALKRDPVLGDLAKKDPTTDETLKELYEKNGYDQRIIFATDAWESSVTLPQLIYVFDSGISLTSNYNAERMEKSLLNKQIARAQAIQRKGRVGRTQPGFCYFMYSEEKWEKMPYDKLVNIETQDFTDKLLEFWSRDGVSTLDDVLKLVKNLITPPPEKNLESALRSLYALSFSSGIGHYSELTELGFFLAKSSRLNDFRYMKTHYYSKLYNCTNEIAIILSILESKKGVEDLFMLCKKEKSDIDKCIKVQKRYQNKFGDFIAGLNVIKDYRYEQYRSGDNNWYAIDDWCKKRFINKPLVDKISKDAQDKKHSAQRYPDDDFPEEIIQEGLYDLVDLEDRICFCLLKGFFINLAVKKGKDYRNLFPEKRTTTNMKNIITKSGSKNFNFCTENPQYIIYNSLYRTDRGNEFIDTMAIPEHIVDLLSDFEKEQLSI